MTTAQEARAHEIWAAAQLAPGESILDGVDRITALLEQAPVAGEPTMADVLDALNVFNPPSPRDGDPVPWAESDFMAVTALPAFIHNVGRAWYAAPAPALPLPATAADIRRFIGSDFNSLSYGSKDMAPCDMDIYSLSAHDLMSAFEKFGEAAPALPLLTDEQIEETISAWWRDDLKMKYAELCRAIERKARGEG